MSHIVLATYGSLGDLHPALALAIGLRARGHTVTLATSESYREKIGALGIAFHPLRPDLLAQGEHIVADIMDGARGSERLLKHYLFPAVREMHADLAPLLPHTDVLIASELFFPAPIFAATHRIRWISYQLAPVSLFSRHDPPILPAPDSVRWLQRRGWIHRLIKRVAKIVSHGWWRPVRDLRAALGLPAGEHPLFEGKYSPQLNLALFSPLLQPPQPDWPANTVQSGFLFHDESGSATAQLPAAVAAFLAAGEAPIVFTLGSAAVYVPGDFYAASAAAAQRLGRRALLLVGKNIPPSNLPASVLAWNYLPYAQIFPDAAAIVHQGGVGTTAQALRAGRPMLVIPFAHDQFDNAARIVRLGAGRTLSRRKYRPERVTVELNALLNTRSYADAATAAGASVRDERGVHVACNAVERLVGAGSV